MMADAAKKRRTQAKKNYTRALNIFNTLLAEESPADLVKPQFDKLTSWWDKLEAAQDEYVELNDDEEDDTFLDQSDQNHQDALKCYSAFLKKEKADEITLCKMKAEENRRLEDERVKREARERKIAEDEKRVAELDINFESEKAEFLAMVESFHSLSTGFQESLEGASDNDKRNEWTKVESEYKLIQTKLTTVSGIGHDKDLNLLREKFSTDAETSFKALQKWILGELKNSSPTSGGVVRSSKDYSTKKEAVHLPNFQGNEKSSPYLKFPSWKKEWEVMIVDYDPKYWFTILNDHLDDAAQERYAGVEEYDEAMKLLTRHFGDPSKVVQCVFQEISSQDQICDGDYRALVSYSSVVERNHNRLKSLKLEHEISNTQCMNAILRKFPRLVSEKWHEHLLSQDDTERVTPFPIFVEWLKSQKSMWECMVVTVGTKSKIINGFVGDSSGGARGKTCFGCKEEGHIKRDCPKGRSSRSDNSSRQPRKPPTTKKFWCALHKGDLSKHCWSQSCMELRRGDPAKRVQLMKENGDCSICCRDHRPSDCPKKDRKCGDGKPNRGCKEDHHLHELFCLEARVFTIHCMGVKHGSDVVLSIMQVRSWRGRTKTSVFFDLGSTSNFVRETFAKILGFKGRPENLSITTLGGVTTEFVSVTVYTCFIRDVNGKVEKFEAFGMETITGAVTRIKPGLLRKIFPHLSERDLHNLKRLDHVDVLIGMPHPSWHPERAEQARGGGDFWLYRGRFGASIGGRYPGIVEGTQKSDDLFHVNHTYHVSALSKRQVTSHELEFCPARVRKYHISNSLHVQSDSIQKHQHNEVPKTSLHEMSDSIHQHLHNEVPDISLHEMYDPVLELPDVSESGLHQQHGIFAVTSGHDDVELMQEQSHEVTAVKNNVVVVCDADSKNIIVACDDTVATSEPVLQQVHCFAAKATPLRTFLSLKTLVQL